MRQILTRAAEEAFEQLGFLMLDPDWMDGNGDPALDGGAPGTGAVTGGVAVAERPMHGRVVRFRGPVEGALVVRADEPLLEALAGNMLGELEAPDLTLQLDALGEIANVICGNVLPVAEDPVSVFRLDAPAPLPEAPVPGAVRGEVRLKFDEGWAAVRLLEEGSSP